MCFVHVMQCSCTDRQTNTHTHTHLTALCPGLPGWAGTRKVTSIWILLKQETLSDSGISWAVCKSAPCSRQITTPTPHHSVFYRPDALPAAQPTASKQWRQTRTLTTILRGRSNNEAYSRDPDCAAHAVCVIFPTGREPRSEFHQ